MELTRLKRYLQAQSDQHVSFRSVLALLNIAEEIREEAEYYDDLLKLERVQMELQSDTDMQRFASDLTDKVVHALCTIEDIGTLGVARRAIRQSATDVELALNEWKDEQNRDDKPLGDVEV